MIGPNTLLGDELRDCIAGYQRWPVSGVVSWRMIYLTRLNLLLFILSGRPNFLMGNLVSSGITFILGKSLDFWYCELFKHLEEMGNLGILDELLCIFNADETGFPVAPWPTKFLWVKGTLTFTSKRVLINCRSQSWWHWTPWLYTFHPSKYTQAATSSKHLWKISIQISHLLSLVTQQMGGWMLTYSRNGWKNLSTLKWKSINNKACFTHDR